MSSRLRSYVCVFFPSSANALLFLRARWLAFDAATARLLSKLCSVRNLPLPISQQNAARACIQRYRKVGLADSPSVRSTYWRSALGRNSTRRRRRRHRCGLCKRITHKVRGFGSTIEDPSTERDNLMEQFSRQLGSSQRFPPQLFFSHSAVSL